MGLFEKKEEEDLLTLEENFLLKNSEIARTDYETTHIRVTRTLNGIGAGVFKYEPQTGSAQDLDGDHIAILDKGRYRLSVNRGEIIPFKHTPTWREWLEAGIVEEEEKEDKKDSTVNKPKELILDKIKDIKN